MENPTIVTASQFRGVLEGNDIPYQEGWDGDEYVFELVDEPDTWFLFENENGESIGVATFES
jgi:hypothetical protein